MRGLGARERRGQAEEDVPKVEHVGTQDALASQASSRMTAWGMALLLVMVSDLLLVMAAELLLVLTLSSGVVRAECHECVLVKI